MSFKIVKQRAFERAIASEEKEEAPLTNYENITVKTHKSMVPKST